VDNEMYLSRALDKLGSTSLAKDQEPDISAAFIKFSVVTKELSILMKTLVRKIYTSKIIKRKIACNFYCRFKEISNHSTNLLALVLVCCAKGKLMLVLSKRIKKIDTMCVFFSYFLI